MRLYRSLGRATLQVMSATHLLWAHSHARCRSRCRSSVPHSSRSKNSIFARYSMNLLVREYQVNEQLLRINPTHTLRQITPASTNRITITATLHRPGPLHRAGQDRHDLRNTRPPRPVRRHQVLHLPLPPCFLNDVAALAKLRPPALDAQPSQPKLRVRVHLRGGRGPRANLPFGNLHHALRLGISRALSAEVTSCTTLLTVGNDPRCKSTALWAVGSLDLNVVSPSLWSERVQYSGRSL